MANLVEAKASAMDNFLQLFRKNMPGTNGSQVTNPLLAFQNKSFRELEHLEFPTRKNENWKYTNFGQVLNQPFQESSKIILDQKTVDALKIPGLDAIYLTFVNGIFYPEFSDLKDLQSGISILPIQSALKDDKFSQLVKNKLEAALEDAENTFETLNLSFAKNGLYIQIDKGVQLEKPVCLLHFCTEGEPPLAIFPQLFVEVGAESKSEIIEIFSDQKQVGEVFSNGLTNFVVGENARLDHYKLQNFSSNISQISNSKVWQKRDSLFNSFVVDLGGKMVRNNLNTTLTGTNTETHFYGIYLPKKDQHIDNQTFIDHAVPNCLSNELYKGVIGAEGRGVFNGKVMVRPDAQKTNAFQKNANLILDDSAIMDSKPQLEIFADDVKCSHGATIGQLSEESIFYLRSRGLTNAAAKALLQYAFLGEVVGNFQIEPVKKLVENWILQKLNQE